MASIEEENQDNAREPSSSRRRRKSLPLARLPLGTFADGQSIYRNQLRKPPPPPTPESSSSATSVDAAADHQQPASLERPAQQQKPQQNHNFINSHRRDFDQDDEESFPNGHVHISQLVLPETTTALLTSFGSPEFSWLESWLGSVPSILLVHQGHGYSCLPGGLEAESLREIGNAILSPLPLPPPPDEANDDDKCGGNCDTIKENQTNSSSSSSYSSSNSQPQPSLSLMTKQQKRRLQPARDKSDWHQMLVKPHMGLMHPKLCLFRNEHGLRVVICGANLYQNQWECQRDVLWIQDFFNTTTTAITSRTSIPTTRTTSNDSCTKSNRLFGDTLYTFCRDLTICATRDDQDVVDRFLYTILGFNNEIDFSTAAGTLVYSFPRCQQQHEGHGHVRNKNDSCTHRGGWKMLAQSVQEQFKLQRQRGKGIMPSTIAQVVLGLKERHDGENGKRKRGRQSATTTITHIKTIHVMSGSLGDVKPDFLEQMKNALRGLPEPGSSSTTSWDAIVAAGRNSPSNSNNSSAVGWQIYWPSQATAAQSMTMQSIRGNMRAIPKAYWQTIPQTARQALFADVVHNPLKASGMTGGFCYPNSHAKIMLSLAPPSPQVNHCREHGGNHDDDEYDEDVSDDEMDESSLHNVLYVGSHNFSICAWGLNDTPPKNVELGIVLTTSLQETRREWIRRLPYKLSSASSSTATTGGCCFSSDANYVPASGWEENMDEIEA